MWGDLPPHLAGDFDFVVQLQDYSWLGTPSQCRVRKRNPDTGVKWRARTSNARHDHGYLAAGISCAMGEETIVVALGAVRAGGELPDAHLLRLFR
jgi:hypothetical protein